jgi:hypothetical protein
VNTAEVSVREQARHEGVSPSLIHRWRKRGMPADLEGGSLWRQRNAARGGSRPAAAPVAAPRVETPPAPTPAPQAPEEPEDPDATKQAVELAERPEEIVIGERSCQETLKALRSSRQYCQSRIAACHKRGDEAMARQWVQTLNNIVSRQAAMEDRLRDILERDAKTMSVEAAERTYRQVFSDLRQKLLAAPAALAAQLNPNDPIHAQGIMENWVRLLFKETYEGQRQEN